MIKKQIGWLIIGKNEKRMLHYETASWYKELLLDEGKFPIYAVFENGRKDANDTSIHASVKGTVLSDSFPSSFGGHMYSSNMNQYVGERDTWHYNPYAHALANGLLKGEVNCVELLDGFEAKEVLFVSSRGENLVTYDIVEVGNEW